MNNLTLSNTVIRQDDAGRFCLNDLHKAAGGEDKHRPGEWLRLQQTQDLIAELEKDEAGIPASKILRGRGIQGTYVCRELVYAYATWISPAFFLKVLRTFDAVQAQQSSQAEQLPPSAAITNRRFLLFFDRAGKEQLLPVDGCHVLRPDQFAGAIADPALTPGEHLPAIQDALTQRTGLAVLPKSAIEAIQVVARYLGERP